MTIQVNKHRKVVKYVKEKFVFLNRRNIKIAKSFDKFDDKKLNLFIILQRLNNVYRCELLEIMRIHDVFHCWFLRKIFCDILENQINEFFDFVIVNEYFQWKVNNILKFRYRYNCQRTCLIKRITIANTWIFDLKNKYVQNDRMSEVTMCVKFTLIFIWTFADKIKFYSKSSNMLVTLFSLLFQVSFRNDYSFLLSIDVAKKFIDWNVNVWLIMIEIESLIVNAIDVKTSRRKQKKKYEDKKSMRRSREWKSCWESWSRRYLIICMIKRSIS